MSMSLKKIEDLGQDVLAMLIREYDQYIVNFFNEGRHRWGSKPVRIDEFYSNDFLGYAEENYFAWRLSSDELSYTFAVLGGTTIKVSVYDVSFEIEVPYSVTAGASHIQKEYIEKYYGDTVMHVMKEYQLHQTESAT